MKTDINFRKLPLEKFIPAVFIVFLLCLTALSLVTYRNIEQYKKDTGRITHSQEILRKNSSINLLLYQLTLFRKGYVVSGDDKYLSLYNESKQNLNNDIRTIKGLISDNIIQQKNFAPVDSLSSEIVALMDSTIEEFNPRKKNSPSEDALTNRIRNNLEVLSVFSSKTESEETKLLNERNLKAADTNNSVQIFIIITSLFGVIIIGLSISIANGLIRNKNETEEMLHRSYDEMEDKVDERTKMLSESYEKLKVEISVREKAEKNLRESEQRFRVMADSAPVLIWMSGKDKLCTYFNKGWLKFTGRKLEDELGNGWAKGVHPNDFDRCLKVYINAFDKREDFEMEYRLKTANGEFRWILDKGVPIFEDKEFKGYIGCCIDIHERKRDERYLKIQYDVSRTMTEAKGLRETMKTILQNVCQGLDWDFGILMVVDKDKNYLSIEALWSATVPALKEYSDMFDLQFKFAKGVGLPGKSWEAGKSFWVSEIKNEDNFPRKNSALNMGWHSAFAVPISNGKETIAVIELFNKMSLSAKQDLMEVLEAVGRQIGNFIERKKAEEELQASYSQMEEKVKDRTIELANTLNKLLKEIDAKEEAQNKIKLFSFAIKGLRECIYITDLNNKTLFVNEAFEDVYGYSDSEVVGKEIPVLNPFHLDPEKKEEIISKTHDGGWKGDFLTRKKDGTEFCVYLSTSIIKNDEGNVEAIIGICQDVTEQIHSREQIDKRNKLLSLINDVILYTNETMDVSEIINYSVNKICTYTGWDIGHYYIKSNSHLITSDIWNKNLSVEFLPLKEITSDYSENGSSFAWQAVKTKNASWNKVSDLNDDHGERLTIAKKLKLGTAVIVPVMKENEVIGVMEFYTKNEKPEDTEILESVKNIGIEIGKAAEREERAREIIEKQKMLLQAQQLAKLGGWEWNVKTNDIKWSDEMYNIYGLDKKTFDHSVESFRQRIHPDDLELLEKTFRDGIKYKHPIKVNHRIITPTGDVKILNSQGELVFDKTGEVTRIIGTVLDITEIKLAEEKLRKNERQLKEAQQLAKLGSWEVDLYEKIQVWSDEMFRIYGYEPGEIHPDFESIRNLTHPDDIAKVNALLKNLRKHVEPAELDYRIITPEGRLKQLHIELLVEKDKNNRPKRLYGSVQDITDIKLAEEELRKTNEKLVQMQKELIHSEKLAALGRFSSGIAHEIRNPLANISALAQLVSKTAADEKSKKHLKYILVNADLANKIIKDLLNFASPDELVLNKESLNEILENLTESIKARCHDLNITVEKYISPMLPEINVDRVKFENALMNFLSNSVEAMPEGGKLSVIAGEDRFSNEVLIQFIDTGVGISPENLDKILEPFFTTKENGTGLGMGMAYQTIKLHNGDFNIQSEIGKGTQVEIKLPVNNKN